MTKDELRKLLDLGGTDAAPPAEGSAVVATEHSQPKASASPTALELDDWALRRGRDLLAASDRLQALDVGEHAVADFHACAFEPEPKLLDACEDERRHEFVKQLLDTPEYRSLHTSTMLSPVASEIAAAAFAEQFADLKTKEKEEPKGAGPADREMATLRAVGRARPLRLVLLGRVGRVGRFRLRLVPRSPARRLRRPRRRIGTAGQPLAPDCIRRRSLAGRLAAAGSGRKAVADRGRHRLVGRPGDRRRPAGCWLIPIHHDRDLARGPAPRRRRGRFPTHVLTGIAFDRAFPPARRPVPNSRGVAGPPQAGRITERPSDATQETGRIHL
jgi:hypothetical protein